MKVMSSHPSVSVIIPARDEEDFIVACIEGLLDSWNEASSESIDLILADNLSKDATASLAADYGARIIKTSGKNLSEVRNHGAAHARGELLVFIDADSVPSKNMFATIFETIEKTRSVGGGVLIYPERWSFGILCTGLLLGLLFLPRGISGGLFFVWKTDFDAINGFDESVVSAEDIDFALRLKSHARRCGKKFKTIYRAHIVTSCRKFDYFGDWYFLLRPQELITLLRGKDRALAEKFWYSWGSRKR